MACKYFHCITTITVGASTVLLTPMDTVTIPDETRFCFKILDSIPESALTLPVTVTVNGTSVALWDKYGNPATGADLVRGRCYKGWYGATTPHIIVGNMPMSKECV